MSSTLESVHIQTDKPQANEDELTYEQQHKPRSEFDSENNIWSTSCKLWRLNAGVPICHLKIIDLR